MRAPRFSIAISKIKQLLSENLRGSLAHFQSPYPAEYRVQSARDLEDGISFLARGLHGALRHEFTAIPPICVAISAHYPVKQSNSSICLHFVFSAPHLSDKFFQDLRSTSDKLGESGNFAQLRRNYQRASVRVDFATWLSLGPKKE